MATAYRQNTWTLREARSTFERQMVAHARGEHLRQLRNKRGLSQEDVAHALGVTAKTYGDWERGGGIQPANVRRVARYFKVKPGELVSPEFEQEPASLNGSLPAGMQEQMNRIEAMLQALLDAQGIKPPTGPLVGPGEGPLLSDTGAPPTSPKAGGPKRGRAASARSAPKR